MDRNHFSRQLIVLRSVIDGYSGHARLIHDDSGRKLEVRIQAPAADAKLYAVLTELSPQGCASRLLGALNVDERGQATGTFPVEKTDIVPDIIAIVLQEEECKLAMSGFPDGTRNVNWADVRASACGTVTSPAPATALLPEEDLFADFGSVADDPFRAPAAQSGETAPAPAETAAQTAGISDEAVWPEAIAALQDAFETQKAVSAWPDSRYTFIRVEATDETPEYLAGVWCAHGLPARAAYAVPGDAPEPCPQGLEDFQWRSCDSGGYWVAYVDAATGEPVFGDN